VIGEMLVIDVRPGLSTALVTHSTRETRSGDRVEARKGY